MPGETPPVMVSFSEATVILSQGGKVEVRTCDLCQAAILTTPHDEVDRLKAHATWHERQRRGWPR